MSNPKVVNISDKRVKPSVYKLRPMTEDDLKITFEWRNDKDVLKHAMSSHPVSWAEHEAIFKYNNAVKLIFEVNGVPVGFTSITQSDDEPAGEWSFYLGAEHRGKGYSSIMLEAVLLQLKKEYQYTGITSRVKVYNDVSNHLHEKLGFEITNTGPIYKEYYLHL